MIKVTTVTGNVYTLYLFGEHGVFSWSDTRDGAKGIGAGSPRIGDCMMLAKDDGTPRRTSYVVRIES